MDPEKSYHKSDQSPQPKTNDPTSNSGLLEAMRSSRPGYLLAAVSVKLAMFGSGAAVAEAADNGANSNTTPPPQSSGKTNAKETPSANASKIYIRGKWRYGLSTHIQAPRFEGVPGLNNPLLTPKDKKCVRPGLVSPVINEAALYFPNARLNDSGQPNQLLRVSAQYPSISRSPSVSPGECDDYRRINQIRGQVEDPREQGTYHSIRGESIWSPFSCSSCKDKEDLNDASEYFYQDEPTSHEPETYYYKCTPGPDVTHARAIIRQRVKHIETNQVLAQRFVNVPITPLVSLDNPVNAAC